MPNDVRLAVRQLRASPSFALAAILTIALAISLNTTMFAIVDAVLLRPLPYPHPDRLAALVTTYRTAAASGFEDSQDGVVWEMAAERVRALRWGAYSTLSSGVTLIADAPRHVRQQRVSSGFFRTLGVQPALGRTFSTEEDRDGGPAAVVLSYALWKTAFGADPSAIGRPVRLRGQPHVIVGVMPAGFRTTTEIDVWTPLRPSRRGEGEGQNYGVVGRLAAGRTWAEADAEVASISTEALQHFRPSPDAHAALKLLPLQRVLTETDRKPLLMLWTAVLLVLVISVANTAGLLAARAAGRRGEFATRRALGASGAAVLRQLAAESAVLAAAGAAGGWLLAIGSTAAVSRVLTTIFGIWQPVAIDGRVIGATALLAVLSTLAIALVPAVQLLRVTPSALAAARVAGPAHRWPRHLLVGGELALTMALVVVSAVLIRSFAHLRLLDPGFDGAHLLAASASLQDQRYASAERINALFETTIARVREVRGVERVAVAASLPYERALNLGFRRLDGPGAPTPGALTTLTYVTPGYVETLGIPTRAGRTIRDADTAASAKVVVVNEAFVRRYLKDQTAIGCHLAVAGATRTVVGVVGDVQQEGWSAPVAPLPAIYAPAAQLDSSFFRTVHVWFAPRWIVKTTAPAADVEPALRRALSDADAGLAFTDFRPLDDARAKALARQRAEAWLLGAFAALALALCAVGAYGLVAMLVVERRREFGIRLALGATPWRNALRASLPGVTLAIVAAVAGGLAARAAIRLLEGLVWGVSAADPVAFAAAAMMLVTVGTVASLLPATAITRLDPAVTLRAE